MYKPLTINFKIPEILERYIDDFISYMNNSNGLSADCYEMEIRNILNGCDATLTEEEIGLLRNYYCRGGIYEKTD